MSDLEEFERQLKTLRLPYNKKEKEVTEELIIEEEVNLNNNDCVLIVEDWDITLYSKRNLSGIRELDSILGLRIEELENQYVYKCRLGPINAFVLRYALKNKGLKIEIDPKAASVLKEHADKIKRPSASLSPDKKHVEVYAPGIKAYKDILIKVNAYPDSKYEKYKFLTSRVLDFENLVSKFDSTLPNIVITKDVLNLTRETIPGYTGTLESLKTIPVDVLNVISANHQTYKAKKVSAKTLSEKMTAFGIKNLHDLLFWLPRRYIDKTEPQDISDLLEGESATILGNIVSSGEMGNNMGAFFIIQDSGLNSIRVSFFRQKWLLNKFKVGDEVLITGKFGWWGRTPQLNGSSIEHSDEAELLPIVPIYKQSESRGITTSLLLSANRELITRMKTVELPEYLQKPDDMDYYQSLNELHFPTSIELHEKAKQLLAYYELVYMQLIIQAGKDEGLNHNGLVIQGSKKKLQNKAIKTLPFELTNSQKEALKVINNKLNMNIASNILVNSDVGTGKTLIAQLSCIQSFDSGYQSVLMGPTEILAQQLYDTFVKLVANLPPEDRPNIAYLNGGLKASERKPILKGVETGEIDILVGTHSVFSKTVKYHNLGVVCIDEQQKFGTEQRESLLNTRNDGKKPHLISQTATPIPRSTAEFFYGKTEMIELKDKPKGRKEIVTQWVREDPVEFTTQLLNSVWQDINSEAEKGNQTFVITPLVIESEKVDAASVERTFSNLKTNIFPNLNVGFVHGQMKKDEQKEEMKKFRNKEYDVLVASTVVEVGVDIPDATRVIILSADRLGASSLHQIRGRVGRNEKESKCYLVSLGKTENSVKRLESLVNNSNGFEIAKSDLSIRGEGTIFGTEQSGANEMIFANISKHSQYIKQAIDDARNILNSSFKEKALSDSFEKFNIQKG